MMTAIRQFRFQTLPLSVCTTQRRLSRLTQTQAAYGHIKRGEYNKLKDEDYTFFKSLLQERALTSDDDLDGFNSDWLGKFVGQSSLVLRPKTTDEVSRILKYCNDNQLAVVPQGGNTGLVGGSVPLFDEIVLSTSLMNNITEIDTMSNVLHCQAGCVLETLNNTLANHGLMMPLDLGAKGSCQIGGNISTNAGGLRYLRYGSLHGTVLGLEVVLANGDIVDTRSGLRKDNTGYDLKQLFIGAEGTLGVITGVSMSVVPKPASVNVAFLACESYTQIMSLLKDCRAQLGEILSAFEFLDNGSMKCVNDNLGVPNPLEEAAPFYVLIETHGSNMEHDQEKLNTFLENVMESGLVSNGTVAQDETQAHALWEIRERITEGLQHDGYTYKYDVSLPLPELYTLVERMSERVEGHALRCVGYGHMGDGNLHLNITSSAPSDELLALIEPFVYEQTASHNGSISAEHGLGLMKPQHIHYSKSRLAINLMQQLKRTMDPTCILNPYKTVI